jgi:hypothetical protein
MPALFILPDWQKSEEYPSYRRRHAAAGASTASTTFGTQTRAIRVSVPGAITATSGVRIAVGDGTPTASATSALLPVNWIEYIIVTSGQKIAVLGNDTVTGNLRRLAIFKFGASVGSA